MFPNGSLYFTFLDSKFSISNQRELWAYNGPMIRTANILIQLHWRFCASASFSLTGGRRARGYFDYPIYLDEANLPRSSQSTRYCDCFNQVGQRNLGGLETEENVVPVYKEPACCAPYSYFNMETRCRRTKLTLRLWPLTSVLIHLQPFILLNVTLIS